MAPRGILAKNRLDMADSVKSVADLTHPLVADVMNRNVFLTQDTIDAFKRQSTFNWVGRNPRPALDEFGNIQSTGLDLLSFMGPVAERHAVIEIPKYRSRRQKVVREGERKLGSSQFGPIMSLVSNRDTFSFSARINDGSIAVEDESGDESLGNYRTYMLVDIDGSWYKEGWDKIIFKPTAAENAFLNDKKLFVGNTVLFDYYVHPQRYQSFFGAPYLTGKVMIPRINDEADYWKSEVKRLAAAGFELPKKEGRRQFTSGDSVPEEIRTLEVEIDLPNFIGKDSAYDVEAPKKDSIERAQYAYDRAKWLIYTARPQVQFITRADEAAYFFHGTNEKRPSWASKLIIESGVRLPKGRTEWNRIRLSKDVAIRFRERIKTERVAA